MACKTVSWVQRWMIRALVAGALIGVHASGRAQGAAPVRSAQAEYTITDLGEFRPQGINASRHVIGRTVNDSYPRSLVWIDGHIRFLNVLEGHLFAGVSSINSMGQMVGGSWQQRNFAVMWPDAEAAPILLPPLPGDNSCTARGINDAGQIVGTSYLHDDTAQPSVLRRTAVVWQEGVVRALPDGADSSAYAINDGGTAVGRCSPGTPGAWNQAIGEAVLWEKGATAQRVLRNPSGTRSSSAGGINSRGQVIGASGGVFKSSATLWTNDRPLRLLPARGDTETYAYSINSSGSIVGSSTSPRSDSARALLWKGTAKPTLLQSLLPPGADWELLEASGINDAGDIVGVGYHNGQARAYLLKLTPAITLKKATTLDAQSVTVDYEIARTAAGSTLHFDVYRSPTPTVSSKSVLIGSADVKESDVDRAGHAALDVGAHSVTLLAGTSLPPIPKSGTTPTLQYVVVVANQDGAVIESPASVETVSFRKYSLGVVAHGFTLPLGHAGQVKWMNQMRDALMRRQSFHQVVLFKWLEQSRVAQPGQATSAGDRLYAEVVAAAGRLAKGPGDVVDVHFIGHSRGTVVTAAALQDFVHRASPALRGSYVTVSLLDIHPANAQHQGLLDYNVIDGNGVASATAVWTFQSAAADPEIHLPDGAGIRKIGIWYQKTPVLRFWLGHPEFSLNLWGIGPGDEDVVNASGVEIDWHDLTGLSVRGIGVIGHNEVPAYFTNQVLDPPAVRRSREPVALSR